MIYFKTTATVDYSCCIDNEEQEKEIMDKAIELREEDRANCWSHPDSYYIEKAMRHLYYEDTKTKIDLYANSKETDFSTDEIDFDDFTGDESAEEIFGKYIDKDGK